MLLSFRGKLHARGTFVPELDGLAGGVKHFIAVDLTREEMKPASDVRVILPGVGDEQSLLLWATRKSGAHFDVLSEV